MNITLITATRDRPEAFKLCEHHMAKQTVKWHQWIVLDDGNVPTTCTMGQHYIYVPHLRGKGSMVGKLRLALLGNIITGDSVVIIEDDDWYSSTWLAWCAEKMKTFDLVGEGRNIYYNVRDRFWFIHNNMAHASLCATSMTRAVFPQLLRESGSLDPFIDVRLWQNFRGKKRVFENRPALTVGIKAMPGPTGYGSGHGLISPGCSPDLEMKKLRDILGDDAPSYAQFYHAP